MQPGEGRARAGGGLVSNRIRGLLETMVSSEALIPHGAREAWRTGPGDEGLPAAVLSPSTEEELAQVLAKASAEGWRVLPAGLGTWLEGGGPSEVSLVVTTRRMMAVHEYEPADLTFTAGAGLSLAALRGTTEPHGQWLPLDPPGGLGGSLGAMVALGAGGGLRHLYGTPRDHILGLTLVSGDGRVLRWGGRVVKNVAGFDVTRLTVGSWGTLGVVTSVSARLFPLPESDVTVMVRGRDLSDLLPLARTMARSSLPLAAVELLDPLDAHGSTSVEAGGAAASPGLVVRLLGSKAQVEEMEARIGVDLSQGFGTLTRLEGPESRAFFDRMDIWEEGADLVARLSLLPSSLGTLLGEAQELGALTARGSTEGARFRLSAHVGAGIVRVAATGLQVGGDTSVAWAEALRRLRARLEEGGGSLTLSSGPAGLLRDVGAWGKAAGEWRIMTGLKGQFDPHGILAPGRLGL